MSGPELGGYPEYTSRVRYVWSEPTPEEVFLGTQFLAHLGEDVQTIDVLIGDGPQDDVVGAYEVMAEIKNGLRNLPPTTENYDFFTTAIPEVALGNRSVVLGDQTIDYPAILFLGRKNDPLYRFGRNMLVRATNALLSHNNQTTIVDPPIF